MFPAYVLVSVWCEVATTHSSFQVALAEKLVTSPPWCEGQQP